MLVYIFRNLCFLMHDYMLLYYKVSQNSTWVLAKPHKEADPEGKRMRNIMYTDYWGWAEAVTQRGGDSQPSELGLSRRRVPMRFLSVGRYAFLFSQGLRAFHGPRDGGSAALLGAASRRPWASNQEEPASECHWRLRNQRLKVGEQANISTRSLTQGGTRLARPKGSYVM
jgi:hypothetical protein